MPHRVGKLDLAEQGQGGVIEQPAIQRGQGEGVAGALGQVPQAGLGRQAATLGHQSEQAAQGDIEVLALPGPRVGQGPELQVAQALQAVALEVDLALLDGHVAQLGAGLDVEEEQQPIDQAQAFQAQVGGVELVLAAEKALLGRGGLLAQLDGGLVAQQFDGLAQGVFQVLADAEGVLVGVVVQAFEQAGAFAGGQAVLVQQDGAGLEGVGVLAVEDVGPGKAQGAVVGPLVAVEQQPLVQPQQQDKARRLVGAEDGLRQQFGPGQVAHALGPGLVAVMEGGELVVEQVLALGPRLVGRDEGQALAPPVPDRQRQPGDPLMQARRGGRRRVAQGLEQPGLQLGEGLPARLGLLPPLPLAAQGEPALGPGLQALVRRALHCAFLPSPRVGEGPGERGRLRRRTFAPLGLLYRLPGLQALPDVALEDLRQVVMTVKLVFVGDASEGLHSVENGHGQPPLAWG